MKTQNLPAINARYWCAIVVASMAGANTGDFAARYLHLGHTRGLLPLALLFLAIVWAEKRARRTTEAFYWLAIIVLRTAVTNLADLMTHDLRLGYWLTLAALAALIVTVLLFVYWRATAARRRPPPMDASCRRPTAPIGSRCSRRGRSAPPAAISSLMKSASVSATARSS